jgi:hypothetical protein
MALAHDSLSSPAPAACGAVAASPLSSAHPGRPGPWAARWRRWLLKIAGLVVTGLVLGWAYAWAATRLYQPQQRAGFPLGLVHGALMPVALPSLLLGQDVPIYAPSNNGRPYKLGYILGINACGFVFFGMAFWKPREPRLAGGQPALSAAQ